MEVLRTGVYLVLGGSFDGERVRVSEELGEPLPVIELTRDNRPDKTIAPKRDMPAPMHQPDFTRERYERCEINGFDQAVHYVYVHEGWRTKVIDLLIAGYGNG